MRLSDKNKQGTHSRREALAGAAMAGMGSLLGTASRVQAQSPMGADEVSVASIGQYDTVLLRQRAIKVSAIQSRARAVDLKNLKKTMQVNLDHLTQLIDYAQGSAEACDGERLLGAKQDLICIREFPIQGFQPWTRAEMNRLAFAALGQPSRENCQRPGPHRRLPGEPVHDRTARSAVSADPAAV